MPYASNACVLSGMNYIDLENGALYCMLRKVTLHLPGLWLAQWWVTFWCISSDQLHLINEETLFKFKT
jgi:hypothetical protein